MRATLLAVVMLFAPSEDRTYHKVAIKDIPTTQWTHVETEGLVTYVKREADGDSHIRLEDDKGHFVVLEITPFTSPKPVTPQKGQRISARGITRQDKTHHWYEVHPLESWSVIKGA